MASDFASRAATAAELIKFRDTPSSVFTARINQLSFGASVEEITYDGGTGTYGDVKAGMLCWIGTGAGLKDIGIAVVRTTADATKIYINTNTTIAFADDQYITIYTRPRQVIKLGLAILHPATLYVATINTAPTSMDNVAELDYLETSGTLADVFIHSEMIVESSTGTYKGSVRIRQLPTATKFFISPTSGIQFASGDVLTVLENVPLRQRDISVNGTITRMDYNIDFGAYGNGGVFPRIAPIVSVLKLTAGTVTFTPPSPALSAAYDGSTIVSYAYSFPGSASSGNLTSSTGTAYAVYTAAGKYRWQVSILDSLGRTTVSHRWVFVDNTSPSFELVSSPTGNWGEGGWSFEVVLYDNVDIANVHNNALCVLYADQDIYGGVSGSIGKITGYENILCTGFIDTETIEFDSESGSVAFTVRSAEYWLSKMRALPFELQDTTTPTNWKQLSTMTVDKALAHLLWWTSTAPFMMDCFFTGDTNRIKVLTQPSGNLLAQLNAISMNTVFAKSLCNNLGQLYTEVDPQMMVYADRAALPIVQDITTADYVAPLDIERITTDAAAMIDFGASAAYDGTSSPLVYSRAPGLIPNREGEIKPYNNYIVADQDDANRISGCLLATENKKYEEIEITLAANNRLIDICPRMYCTMTVASADNIRGIAITAARMIPRKVTFEYDNGSIQTKVGFELESIPVDGVTYTPPRADTMNVDDFDIGDMGALDFPAPTTAFPPTVPAPLDSNCSDATVNTYATSWDSEEIRGDDAVLTSQIYFPCTVRASAAAQKTIVPLPTIPSVYSVNENDAAANITLYGVKDGARVVTAAVVGSNFVFSPIAEVIVDGFEIEMTAGLGATPLYVPLGSVGSYSPNALNNQSVEVTGLTIGNYYCLDGSAGPWYGYPLGDPSYLPRYDFQAYDGTDYIALQCGYDGNAATMKLTLGAQGLLAEAINSLYARAYWQADYTNLYVRCCNDPNPSDNTGSLTIIVRNVRVDGRRVLLGSAIINNVCPP